MSETLWNRGRVTLISRVATAVVGLALTINGLARSVLAQDTSPAIKPVAPFSELKVKLSVPTQSFPDLNLAKTATAEKSFTITNLGTEALSVTVGSPTTSDFSVIAGAGSTMLGSKGSETVTVEFEPTGAGSFSDAIVISSDATKGKPDVTVKLKGSAKGAITASGKFIFVANFDANTSVNIGDSVTAYPVTGSGNIAPSINISGSNPSLFEPSDITVDSKGNIYVANETGGNSGNGSVTVYAAGSKGNVAPTATIAGPDTGLSGPSGIALDAAGNIYVSNLTGGPTGLGCITKYPVGSNGDITPTATIYDPNVKSPSATELTGIAVDQTTGIIFVAADGEGGGPSVVEYAAGSNGPATPIAVIAGSNTGIVAETYGIALNPVNGDIYVATLDPEIDGTILVYAAGSEGNVAPKAAIKGPDTGLGLPIGVALDSGGTIYVTNLDEDTFGSITVYPPGSDGNATPSATIEGTATESNTALYAPYGIAIGP